MIDKSEQFRAKNEIIEDKIIENKIIENKISNFTRINVESITQHNKSETNLKRLRENEFGQTNEKNFCDINENSTKHVKYNLYYQENNPIQFDQSNKVLNQPNKFNQPNFFIQTNFFNHSNIFKKK
ncbi:hypothetical protein DMUE_1831 [Dictyocoela muelleri]|nr:hypothetical protein DMUE_1831 [Dictyocoela muelleri]